MNKNDPQGIVEFPLTENSARKIINDLAENHTNRIRWTKHVKEMMAERGVTSGQIYTLLKSKHAVFREGPYPEANGDWKFNLKGYAAGELLELVVALKNHDHDPKAKLVTVWIK
ncbi:hypothetical protein SAMN05216262_13112 [Colwellia chukchiensis]|uniref:Uncharacterized protein n=1 Tax=Colwellia chukchiensis TaxID=641665 RepID=A0A1H7TZW5_9GAMM|nr:DUF4258 domain-containing protein [Colwellia chukchiensis]SEL90079.1 hypothetical protein SAMN05216262_13112 [Colwellia chukchiensis]